MTRPDWDAEARETLCCCTAPEPHYEHATYCPASSPVVASVTALARRAERKGLERAAAIAEEQCVTYARHPAGCDVAAAIRREIERREHQPGGYHNQLG